MKKKYTLELNKNQLSTIRKACEFYSRFCAGQMELPLELSWKLLDKREGNNSYRENRKKIATLFSTIKDLSLKLNSGETLGIGSEDLIEEAKVCYDIYRPILELFEKEYKEENNLTKPSYSVYSYEGLSYSKEGRIKIKVN